jgi:16S rRNA (guanine527-N7)-methyltransferase
VDFEGELTTVLPADLPNRTELIRKATLHLERIREANERFNLTRITSPREAAIKHVLDSLMPWKLFANASHVLDAGTGAGFPGIPLALVLPSVRFTLTESIGKKALFVERIIDELGLQNARILARRAEDVLRSERVDVLTARAVAPIARSVDLFGRGLRSGTQARFYKGPDARTEISEARTELLRHKLKADVIFEYKLPDALGTRAIVEMKVRS